MGIIVSIQGGGNFCIGIYSQERVPNGENSAPIQIIQGKILHQLNPLCIGPL